MHTAKINYFRTYFTFLGKVGKVKIKPHKREEKNKNNDVMNRLYRHQVSCRQKLFLTVLSKSDDLKSDTIELFISTLYNYIM